MSILLSGEMEVDGNLKVTGSVESTTIDSLKAVIADLQAQLAALQVSNRLETRVYELPTIIFTDGLEYNLNLYEITGYDLTNYSIVIYDVLDFQVTDDVNAAADFALEFKYNHPVYGWLNAGGGGSGDRSILRGERAGEGIIKILSTTMEII